MNVRFNIKWLLLFIALCAGGAAWAAQAGMVIGHVEVLDNTLVLNDKGTVDGKIQWRFSRADAYSHRYSDYVCTLTNIARPELVKIPKGDRTRIRYRLDAVGPLPSQNPYSMFINQRFGIPNDQIVGFVHMDGWTEIVIQGGE